jgi:hypothetical protein
MSSVRSGDIINVMPPDMTATPLRRNASVNEVFTCVNRPPVGEVQQHVAVMHFGKKPVNPQPSNEAPVWMDVAPVFDEIVRGREIRQNRILAQSSSDIEREREAVTRLNMTAIVDQFDRLRQWRRIDRRWLFFVRELNDSVKLLPKRCFRQKLHRRVILGVYWRMGIRTAI